MYILSESRSYDKNKHIRTEYEGKSEIKCTKCTFTSANLSNLSIHITITHEEVHAINCKMCDFSNSEPNKVKEHIETYHEKIF